MIFSHNPTMTKTCTDKFLQSLLAAIGPVYFAIPKSHEHINWSGGGLRFQIERIWWYKHGSV